MSLRAIEQVREDCALALQGQTESLSPLRGDTLLITGGTGFVGTWLTEMLACLNDRHSFGVRILLLSRGTAGFRSAFPHLANRKDVSLIQSDVRHPAELPKETGWVIHAAGTPDNRFHSTNPVETMNVIAEGTAAVIRAVDRCSNFKKLLNVSSGLVYGPQPLGMERISETHMGAPAAGSVSAAYAEAKRFAETYCAAARSQQRLPVVNARPFAFIGPYQPLKTPWAINNFIHDALTANVIRVLGDGQTVRSYLYGSDMAFWLLRILTAGISGQSYNVGSPEGIALADLASLIADNFTPKPEIRLNASGVGAGPKTRFVPDVSKATQALGLAVKVPLAAAIERTIHWNRAFDGALAKA